MKKIKAVDTPDVRVIKFINGYTETPALERFLIEVYDSDMEAEEAGAPAGSLICSANVVVFNPKKGNVVDDGDADSQDLMDVATAFFNPSGQTLSHRAEGRGAETQESMHAVPLIYVDGIATRREFEGTGQDVLGVAIGMAEIASQYGMAEKAGIRMMSAIYKDMTLTVCSGEDFKNEERVALDARWQSALGVKKWVGDGELFATEDSHPKLSKVSQQMLGFGGRLSGNELLGAARFEPAFKVENVERSEAEMSSHVARLVAIDAGEPDPALAQAAPPVANVAGKVKAKRRVSADGAEPSATKAPGSKAA